MSLVRFGLDTPDSILRHYQQNTFPIFCSTYWAVCGLSHRKRDLEQLVAWAAQKHLERRQQFYTRLLIDTDQRLWHWQRRAPFACLVAKFAVRFASLLDGKTEFRKGHAARFRDLNNTGSKIALKQS